MGHTSFLTASTSGSPQSVAEALFNFENCSTIFLSAWGCVPPDLQRAGRVSTDAMTYLDHIVNEILRARDAMKGLGTYGPSSLKCQLDIPSGLMINPVSRAQQQALIDAGPGQGALPGPGTPITLEKLLNKVKHRHHAGSNFRIDGSGRHIFLVNVDKPNQTPDSIVEFDVRKFCEHCGAVAPLV